MSVFGKTIQKYLRNISRTGRDTLRDSSTEGMCRSLPHFCLSIHVLYVLHVCMYVCTYVCVCLIVRTFISRVFGLSFCSVFYVNYVTVLSNHAFNRVSAFVLYNSLV